MAFLRFTRDRRGYENTFLLHAFRPGERPVVLYWYRSAPGVRVGRPALDEDAIRTIEEQHPEVEFDWPHILEVGAVTEPEVEERLPRVRRRGAAAGARGPVTPAERAAARTPAPALPADDTDRVAAGDADTMDETAVEDDIASVEDEALGAPRPHDLLEELVGHEIATRLHARYAEILGRIHRLPADNPQRAAFEARAEALNPDNWVTPDEVLRGVQHADAVFDALRKALLAH